MFGKAVFNSHDWNNLRSEGTEQEDEFLPKMIFSWQKVNWSQVTVLHIEASGSFCKSTNLNGAFSNAGLLVLHTLHPLSHLWIFAVSRI